MDALTCLGTITMILSLGALLALGLISLIEGVEDGRQTRLLASIATGDPEYDTAHIGMHMRAVRDREPCALCTLDAEVVEP